MDALCFKLKSRYSPAIITRLNSKIIGIEFANSEGSIVIQKGTNSGRFTVSYPALILQPNGNKKCEQTTSNNILEEGLFWILNQINTNGWVMPEC